ncbi:MAG TPA: NADPH-dependent FMN reductase [Gemmatimonadaceae bacterium]|nr:NADPH-dependent FMN reductase [Gemmatimonadaceae bacterium]
MPSATLLAISGSLRARSSNTEVLRAAAHLAPADVRVTLYDALGGLPHFNPDRDTEGAEPPAPVRDLRARLAAADALLICSPEYAHGVPGSLKNALDWLVSGPEMVGKAAGLINASPRSAHAFASLAETLRTMSARLVPGAVVTLPLAGRAMDAAAIAADPELAAALRSCVAALVAATRAGVPDPG